MDKKKKYVTSTSFIRQLSDSQSDLASDYIFHGGLSLTSVLVMIMPSVHSSGHACNI